MKHCRRIKQTLSQQVEGKPGAATNEEAAAAVFEVRTVPEDLDGANGIMRKVNVEGMDDRTAAEDRFCWPPATPTCVSFKMV